MTPRSTAKIRPQAYQALHQFKSELAEELGINPHYRTGYWGNVSWRDCVAPQGQQVRQMIAAAERELLRQGPFSSTTKAK